jgi:hypothetical protein
MGALYVSIRRCSDVVTVEDESHTSTGRSVRVGLLSDIGIAGGRPFSYQDLLQ